MERTLTKAYKSPTGQKNRNSQGQASVPLCDSGKFCHTNRNDPKKTENVLLFPNLIETFLEGTPENRQFTEDIVYIRFRAYFLLLLKNWREGMTERCQFMAESLAKYPALEQLEEVRRFTKLIRLYARCPWLGKLYTNYYVHKGKIKA